jgi:hypothetical protein
MVAMAFLKINGWGPFPIPGEKARLRRLERSVDELLAKSPALPARDQTRGPVGAPPTPTATNPPPKPLTPHSGSGEIDVSGRSWPELDERKIVFEDQTGIDVAELQHRLVKFGFLQGNFTDGTFDEDTRTALAEFQRKFGIYVDGVAGSVTAKVMRFLDKIEYGPDTVPVSEDHRVLIQTVARSQTHGIALIGNNAIGQRSGSGQLSARLRVINKASRELVKALYNHPLLQGAEFPEGWTTERAIRQSNSIRAELVFYLDVLDTADVGPGAATFFFRTGTSESTIGAPLAACIHDELLKVPGVQDRGCVGEDSPLLQGPTAPTIRIELGNLKNRDDRIRLEDQDHIMDLTDAIVAGISRLYNLDLPPDHNSMTLT